VLTKWLFWVAATLMVYIYVGYPLLARVLAKAFGRGVAQRPLELPVTVVVAAYNEERGISAKLDNLLALDYPPALLHILVASDGSTDRTDEIVRACGDPRVQLLRVEGRVGKTACQNRAVEAATGDIVVFTDATTAIERGALRALLENFADPAVGCAAAQLAYVGKGEGLTASGGTAYWSYEIALRLAESSLGSLIGVSGCLYAVRRAAYRAIRPELISDFVIAMRMREQGLRTVLEPRAVCFEDTLERSAEELSMRVRVAIRSINALVAERQFMNPLRHGWFALQLISHKALRYASPFIWAVGLAANLLLASSPFYVFCLAAQLAVLFLGIAGFLLHARGRSLGVLGKPYYFVLTNLASLLATLRYLRGERMRIWNPVRT
jgi:cellulose synthase/poly-beta-1,6-N-acetylglucosamine synthase-like glycosyltransferase